MRALLQRVSQSAVQIDGANYSEIGKGALILLGVEQGDSQEDIEWLVRKILNMRVFPDEEGKMNLSILDEELEILVVSQFTLHANTKKGNRPSYQRSAAPDEAERLYNEFVKSINRQAPTNVKTGEFAANMQVSLVNDGPVTILLDSRNKDI